MYVYLDKLNMLYMHQLKSCYVVYQSKEMFQYIPLYVKYKMTNAIALIIIVNELKIVEILNRYSSGQYSYTKWK